MGNEVTQSKSFEDRMRDRIKESIGDLITDEELSRLVNRGLEDVFFKPTTIKVDTWNTKAGPSLIHGLVKEVMSDRVREAVELYVRDHQEDVMAAVSKVVSEGAGAAVMSAVGAMFQSQMWTLQNNIGQQIQNLPR